MRWFSNDQPISAPAPKEAKYSVDKVKECLDTFGQQRLFVRDPQLKVLISKVTWGALPYLQRISGDKPSGDQLAHMMTTLKMLTEALQAYVKIQNNPDGYQSQGGPDSLMRQGYNAVEAYYKQLSSETATGEDLSTYQALTSYLTGNIASI
jgi:hypothetical protein